MSLNEEISPESAARKGLQDLQAFFAVESPTRCRKTILADSSYRSGYLRLARSNGNWERVLVTLDGGNITCRKSFQSPTVRARFGLTETTRLLETSRFCFVLESGTGSQIEFAATDTDMRNAWVDSIKANRAWIANQAAGFDDVGRNGGAGKEEVGAADAAGTEEVTNTPQKQSLSGSLPAAGCSFSDHPSSLVQGWNFVSETSLGTAFNGKVQQ